MDYEEIAVRMKSFNEERGEETEDEIWVLEHNSVYTYGVSTDLKNIPSQLPYPVLSSDRGGKITYHGPGQLVVYILMDFHILNESLSSSYKSAVITLALFAVNALLTIWVML